ncbi:unnamed protein product [Cylicocyclus nassatus]|uniref:Uncharacterized protein n=1 Tax=Cylicocyclus nassatus TaxID=53992 RepID=A0AA36GVF1_CYLNA|nr:unnamed protein product [Cylicocyclus nassatus]
MKINRFCNEFPPAWTIFAQNDERKNPDNVAGSQELKQLSLSSLCLLTIEGRLNKKYIPLTYEVCSSKNLDFSRGCFVIL